MECRRVLSRSVITAGSLLAASPVAAQTTDAQYTRLLEEAGTKAEDGREALAMLTALLSRKDASDTAVDALRELVLAATPGDAVLLRSPPRNDVPLVPAPDRARPVLVSLAAHTPGNATNHHPRHK